MSSPDTPPQGPTPDSPEAHEAPPGPPPATEASGAAPALAEATEAQSAPPAVNGHPSDEADAPAPPAEEHAADKGAEHAGQPGEKKRRRRRRRKKGGAHAGEGAAAEGAEEGAEGTVEGHAEGKAGGSGEKADKPHDKKKKEKKGPPRERAPVNAGDIVFGKITEITDDAILVDIPGKAHAIFDCLEMLLPDDDERQPAPAVASAPPPADAAAVAQGAPEPSLAGGSQDAEQPAEEEPAPAPEAAQASEASPAPEPAVTQPEPPSPEPPVTQAESEPQPRKEPKVPRVILEVGADFIGVVHNDGLRGGLVVLTHHPHRADRAKAAVEKAYNDKTMIHGLVTGIIKGGLEIDVDGLRAFAPGSHVDLRLGADLSHLVAKRLPFLVTQYAKRGRDLVLSRKPMLEEEAKQARAEALSRIKVGEEVEGVVRSVVPFGAFVDVGGVEGLVPLQEMSHNRADGPADVFQVGETTRVKISRVDEKGKIWLSHKATIPDPWQEVARKYAVGTRHTGKVARIQPFGAFIELESGVDGLIHTQDLSIKRIETPSDVVKVGDPIEVVVAHLDASSRKIGLHPALQGDAANEAPQRAQPHKPLKVKVVTIESGGLVVRALGVTGRNARGYITAAGTGTPRGTELRKVFSVGQEIDAKVIEIDPRRGEIKLSIKALSEDQERNAYQQYRQQLKAEARFTFGDLLAKKIQK